jgi:hypothetical protein
MEAAPEKGSEKGDFFHREENPFRDIDEAKRPSITEAPEELETNVYSSWTTR